MNCEYIIYRTRDGVESALEKYCSHNELRPGDILTKPVKARQKFATPENQGPFEVRDYRAKMVPLTIFEEV